MSNQVRLLSYPELLDKGYKINRKGELQNEKGWIIIEPQEFTYLGKYAEIASVDTLAEGGLYCSLMMEDGAIVEYVLEDCIEFMEVGLTLRSIASDIQNMSMEIETCDEVVEMVTPVHEEPLDEYDVSEAMYRLVEIAEKCGFEIVVSCSIKKDGRRINMNYQREE